MVQTGRWSGRQESDRLQSVWRCVSEVSHRFRKTGELKEYYLLVGSSGQLGIRATGLEDNGIVRIHLERSVVRISS